MARYRAQTIQERGGLEKHLTNLGISYKLFKQLRQYPKQTKTSIADALTIERWKESPRAGRVQADSVAYWIEIEEKLERGNK